MAIGAAGGVGGAQRSVNPWDASIVGIALVVATLLGLAAGYWLDRWLGTSGWLTMIGFAVGVIAGFVNLFRSTKGKR